MKLAREIAAIRMKSNARLRKQAKDEANARLPSEAIPAAAPIMFCSAM